MKKISASVAIISLAFLIVVVMIAEFVLGDKEHGSIYLDPYKKVMYKKMDDAQTPHEVLGYIKESIHNQPFIYRQVLFLSVFGSLLATCFLTLILPSPSRWRGEHSFSGIFFAMFFVLVFVFFMELAFLNFHYYQQKEDMVKRGVGILLNQK